jgi:hypothetical protein
VYKQPVSSPRREVIGLVDKKLNGNVHGNYHFFVNSVKFIAAVLSKTEVNPDDVKIVCANSPENKLKLNGYNIGKPSDEARKINFYTSTCFEGCDLFDENGKTFIISDGRNPNTLYDISTLFVQIIGRIRDSNYKNSIMHVFSNTQYKGDVSYDDFKKVVEREFNQAEQTIEAYNSDIDNIRKFTYDR